MGKNYFEKRNLYSDQELIEAYMKYGSQIKAAEHLKVSRETIARACRRNDISLTGWKNNGSHDSHYGGGAQEKITETQLREEVLDLSIYEIACKYSMSPSTVYKRAKRLHLKFRCGIGFRSSWEYRCKAYGIMDFDKTITLPKLIKRDKGICQICGLPVDCNARSGRSIYKYYPTLDHIIPISKGGSHTWKNVRLAHMICNAGKGDRLEVSE